MKKKQQKAIEELLRKERIEQLGGFGKRRDQVFKDITKYSRKTNKEDSHHG